MVSLGSLLELLLEEKSLSPAALTRGILDKWDDFCNGKVHGRNEGEAEGNGFDRECGKVEVFRWDWK